jgi:pimeloyl-ACP methyl ester carboxylesterase
MATLDYGMFELIVKRGLYHKTNLTSELMEYFWYPMKTALGRKAFLHFAKCLDNKNLTDIELELRHLSVKTLIVRGKADVYLTDSISKKLHSEIPKSQLISIETGGHFVQEDEPELLSYSIRNFIQQKDGIKT